MKKLWCKYWCNLSAAGLFFCTKENFEIQKTDFFSAVIALKMHQKMHQKIKYKYIIKTIIYIFSYLITCRFSLIPLHLIKSLINITFFSCISCFSLGVCYRGNFCTKPILEVGK